MSSDYAVVADERLSKYVYVFDKKTSKRYPVKRISKPNSRFSNAHWLQSKAPIVRGGFAPKIIVEPDIRGEIHYYAWENTLCIPSDKAYCSQLN